MYRLKTTPWAEIAGFYRDLVQNHGWPIQPMLDLVSFIERSSYSQSLFACTSHELLLVTRVPDPYADECRLEIRFDRVSQSFMFRYLQRFDDAAPWSRTCGANEGIAVFERLMVKRLRWFSHGKAPGATFQGMPRDRAAQHS